MTAQPLSTLVLERTEPVSSRQCERSWRCVEISVEAVNYPCIGIEVQNTVVLAEVESVESGKGALPGAIATGG
jgi:hypothetical protein